VSKDYSEFLGQKHKRVLAKQKVSLCFVKTLSVFICWACSSVSEKNYDKAIKRKAFS
jgi:hypothetical protein